MNQQDGQSGVVQPKSQTMSDYVVSEVSKSGLLPNTVMGSCIKITKQNNSPPATGTAHLDSEPQRCLWGPDMSAVAEGQL